MKFGSDIRTGAPVATDADPNTTAPSEDRVLRSPSTPTESPLGLFASAEGGTSFIVQVWLHDPGMGRWQKLGAPATIEAGNVEDCGVGIPLGARVFPQLTTVTGVTKAGFSINQR